MYTKIELDRFNIKAKLKLGNIAETIFEASRVGEDVDDLLYEWATFKLFINTLNSPYCTWDERNTEKRIGHFSYRYSLSSTYFHNTDWIDEVNIVFSEGVIIPASRLIG